LTNKRKERKARSYAILWFTSLSFVIVLKQKTRIRVWLYENADLRIEGVITVRITARSFFLFFVLTYISSYFPKGLWWIHELGSRWCRRDFDEEEVAKEDRYVSCFFFFSIHSLIDTNTLHYSHSFVFSFV
jgi:hypothetical protein